MKIMVIDGDPKKGGFIPGCLYLIGASLASRGAETQTVRLAERDVRDCTGCFHCLKTGDCVIADDMAGIIAGMRSADGFVIGSPVRNGLTTACYKRFLERITFVLGFSLALEDKYTLAVGSVGFMGGRSVCKTNLGLQGPFHTRLSGFVFHAVGMPPKMTPEDLRPELERAAGQLMRDIETRRPRSLMDRAQCAIDRLVMGRLMLRKQPETYAHVLRCWKDKNYL